MTELERNKHKSNKIVPVEFNMLKREADKNKKALVRSSSELITKKTIVNSQYSLQKFKRAVELGKNVSVHSTKKTEDAKRLRLSELN